MTLARMPPIVLSAVILLVLAGRCAVGQESLLRITSPVTGDVVMEVRPLRITVSSDESVRVLGVLSGYPIPEARPVGNNQFEIVIPKTVAPGKYNLTAVGMATTDVESSPVSIQVEREDPATELEVLPPVLSFGDQGEKFPLRVFARFADGSNLDVTHSAKTTFTPKDPQIVRVDDWGMAIAVGPGQSSVMVSYGAAANTESGAVYGALLVNCPRPKPTGPPPVIDSVTPETGIPGLTAITIRGREFGERQGDSYVCIGTQNGLVRSWTDDEIVATVPKGTHRGTIYVMHGGLASNLFQFVPLGLSIEAATGKLIPGGEVHLLGSGFGSVQGRGYVTVGDAKVVVVGWNST